MKIFLRKITTYLISIILLICIANFSFPVQAQSLDDINKQIQDTNAQKTAMEQNLANAQNLLKSLQNQSYSVSGDINVLKSQIDDMNNKINDAKNQIATLEKDMAETQAELDFQRTLREDQIREYFIASYTNDPVEMILSESADLTNFQTVNAIQAYNINNKKKELDATSEKFVQLSEQKKQVDELKAQLDAQSTQLNQKKTELESKYNAIASNIGSTTANANSIKSTLGTINSNLSYLNATQKKLLDAELAKMAANQQVQQTPVQNGQYFFMGRGRDLIEGHGMGMSQWGAYGMALNFGWTYDQILKFYYTGVTIGDYQEPSRIIVKNSAGQVRYDGDMTGYLAGIGEVPNNWPAEAIKAQVVAARTYAMGTCGNQSPCTICDSASCQVYNGGTGKQAYADATKGKVILYNGAPIVAYFSASHRGCSSTLSTVWGSTDKPYIQSVTDDPYAYKDYKSSNPYNPSQMISTYNWQWRTNGYSLDDLSNILSKSSSMNVGKLSSISTSKDRCGRVAKITLTGSAGTKTLTGWDFRAIFNDVTPYDDYIYSTEFGFYQK